MVLPQLAAKYARAQAWPDPDHYDLTVGQRRAQQQFHIMPQSRWQYAMLNRLYEHVLHRPPVVDGDPVR